MTELFTIRFTTKKLINKLDRKGNVVAQERLDTPITMHALPHTTAMSYSGCDNFTIEPYQWQDRYRSKGSGRPEGVGNGHKDRFAGVSSGMKVGRELSVAIAGKNVGKSTVNAAETGDLSAAISR